MTINLKRGLFRMWVVFTVGWIAAFGWIAYNGYVQGFRDPYYNDIHHYEDQLKWYKSAISGRCDGPTPAARCGQPAIDSDPTSPTNAELDKIFKASQYLTPPSRPKMTPLLSADGFDLVLKYVVIGLLGPILLYVLGCIVMWVAKGFAASPSNAH